MDDIDQMVFLAAESTNGIGPNEEAALKEMRRLSREGLEKLMNEEALDAIVTPESGVSSVLVIGGYPGISVPAGYDEKGVPFGICFWGLRGSELRLIEIAYGFEQVTKTLGQGQAFGLNGGEHQPLVDNTPYDSGYSLKVEWWVGVGLAALLALVGR
ncbi:hypothetical protein QJS10_CPA01g00417 [Acorus calamus]|uniref:Amidase n=1 Tax=Acorus calamus TaxID=4465 RepID=A0AAV9FE70_ACOCL|nr:hypothetical protein QJS10_CPA01g00417 [Acorus calamus]